MVEGADAAQPGDDATRVEGGAVKRYLKGWTESDLGAGTEYIELTDWWETRKVEIFGDRWLHADRARGPNGLADQSYEQLVTWHGSLEVVGLEDITAEEFDRVWQEALKHC